MDSESSRPSFSLRLSLHCFLLPMFEKPDLPVCLVDVRYYEGRTKVLSHFQKKSSHYFTQRHPDNPYGTKLQFLITHTRGSRSSNLGFLANSQPRLTKPFRHFFPLLQCVTSKPSTSQPVAVSNKSASSNPAPPPSPALTSLAVATRTRRWLKSWLAKSCTVVVV